jgi:hypothetical protein
MPSRQQQYPRQAGGGFSQQGRQPRLAGRRIERQRSQQQPARAVDALDLQRLTLPAEPYLRLLHAQALLPMLRQAAAQRPAPPGQEAG